MRDRTPRVPGRFFRFRWRHVAIGQLVLAGEYQAVLDDVLIWTKELRATIQKPKSLVSGEVTS
jgi:hypothetical protein